MRSWRPFSNAAKEFSNDRYTTRGLFCGTRPHQRRSGWQSQVPARRGQYLDELLWVVVDPPVMPTYFAYFAALFSARLSRACLLRGRLARRLR